MLFRQFGLIGYSGGAHAPPSLQPCPSFTSSTTQQPVAYNTAPPPVNTPVCTPDPPLCLYFFANCWQVGPPMVHRPRPLHHASGMPFSSFPCGRHTAPWSPTATPPPPLVPLVSRPMYLCFPRMMGYPLRTGTRPDSTPRLSATAPGHGVWGDHFCVCPLCSIIYYLASSRRRRDPSLPTC